MSITEAPTTCPFGQGEPLVVVVDFDIETPHGNVQIPAGTYTGWQTDDLSAGYVTIWSKDVSWIGCDWTGLAPWDWHLPGQPPANIPEHDCWEEARSTVTGDMIICGMCREVLT